MVNTLSNLSLATSDDEVNIISSNRETSGSNVYEDNAKNGDSEHDENEDYDEDDYEHADEEEDVVAEGDEFSETKFLGESSLNNSFTRRRGYSSPSLSRRLTQNDASSLVGGDSLRETLQSLHSLVSSSFHPLADSSKPLIAQETVVANEAEISSLEYNQSQKVFSFSLPFGGFSNIRSNLYKHIQSIVHGPSEPEFQESEESRPQLQRVKTTETFKEAEHFRNYKGTDNVRMRAVRSSVQANLSELLPDFLNNHKKKEPWESIFDEIEGNIVIMGGYRGSILRDAKSRKRVWIPIKAGFNLRKINLLLGPTKEDELNASKYIIPDGVLKNIGPIDICRRLIKRLSSNPNANVVEFGYDWRLSGPVLSQNLINELQRIHDETGKPSLIIAHSMGGLITHGALQQRPDLFRSIVYVGSPSECLNILGPIRFGDSVILSDKILTYETNFMMRSSFLFLPLHGSVFINRDTHDPYDLDLFDPEVWVKYNLNPLVLEKRRQLERRKLAGGSPTLTKASLADMTTKNNESLAYLSRSLTINSTSDSTHSFFNISLKLRKTSSTLTRFRSPTSPYFPETETFDNDLDSTSEPEIGPKSLPYSFSFTESYNYLAETLAATKEFLSGLEFKEELADKYPPMAIVYGNTVPSVRFSVVRHRQDIKDGNYYEFYYGHGDGVVNLKFLMPEKKNFNKYDPKTGRGYIVGKFVSDCGHVSLMTDFKAMGMALSAVCEAETTWNLQQHSN